MSLEIGWFVGIGQSVYGVSILVRLRTLCNQYFLLFTIISTSISDGDKEHGVHFFSL
jgi:hypothetical protein